MGQESFSDAVLVLLGHGTVLNPGSEIAVYQHAAALRVRNLFAEVREAFWKQEPLIKIVLPQLKHPRVFIMPLFISEGYFGEEVIPRELGFRSEGEEEFSRCRQMGQQELFYCKPAGTHQSMTSVLLARAREVVEQFPFPRVPAPEATTLFVAGHGTEKSESSREAIDRQVKLVQDSHIYAAVHGVFLDEEPRIGKAYELAQTRNIVLVPFFISNGMHTQQDIPVLLGEKERTVQQRLERGQPPWRNPTEKHGKLVWYSSSVGTHPLVSEVILERVREAAKRMTNDK